MAENQPNTQTAPETGAPGTEPALAADPMADAVAFLESAAPPDAGDQAEEAPKETQPEAAKPEAPPEKTEEKPPELSPQMQAVARKEKRLLEQQQAFRAEREAFDKERTEWMQQRGQLDDFMKLARTDIVTLADKVSLSADDRMRLATELYYSAQPEDKRPADYRVKSQTRSEVEEVRKKAEEALKRAEAAERALTEQRQRAEAERVREQTLSGLEVAVEQMSANAPYTSAFLKHDRAAVREDLWTLAVNAYNDDPEIELTPADLVNRYESILAKRYAPLKTVFGVQDTPKNAAKNGAENKPPTTLSAARTASPTPTRGKVEAIDDDVIPEEALAFLATIQR